MQYDIGIIAATLIGIFFFIGTTSIIISIIFEKDVVEIPKIQIRKSQQIDFLENIESFDDIDTNEVIFTSEDNFNFTEDDFDIVVKDT